MSDKLKLAEDIVMAILRNDIGERRPSEEELENALTKSCLLNPLSDEEYKDLKNLLHSKLSIYMDLGIAVVNQDTYKPWLRNRKFEINQYYWNRYRNYLERDKGWNANVIYKLDEVGDDMLNLLGDPLTPGDWIRKGLILGDIQSGKTSNYITLCNKAADAGYKIIIILSGTLENLRVQTQRRIDEGLVGRNSEGIRDILKNIPTTKADMYVGVGLHDTRRNAYPFTSVNNDFKSSLLQSLSFTIHGLPEPVVLVIKKNKTVLRNLETWLRVFNAHADKKIDLPLLIIDDESDYASVNTRDENDPTAINEGIRKLIKLFRKVTYVAVTATPFANIFINPDKTEEMFEHDLFPSDFIYSLSPPSNYIGSNAIFGDYPVYDNCLCKIEDASVFFPDKHKSNLKVNGLPASLKKAMGYFILVNALRDKRGHKNTHRSMLVNVSRFTNVQIQVTDLIREWLYDMKSSIQNFSKLSVDKALSNTNIKFLYDIWREYKLEENTGVLWNEVQQEYLYRSADPICVQMVNQKTKTDRLSYEAYKENGLRVIAIGGDSLSRGLTLEDLCVSYFYRNSQMYDTLMQMGRWFGYRDGYDDLFKIWMTEAAIGWYNYITMASNELREEIHEMNRMNLTPKDFGLKVRQHPDSLIVTARNKMKYATISENWVSLTAKLIETPRLIARKESLLSNINATNDLFRQISDIKPEYDGNQIIFRDVSSNIIADYIKLFSSHPKHMPFRAKELADYIESSEHLKLWDIAIPSGSGTAISSDDQYFSEGIKSLKIHPASRVMSTDSNCLSISGERARVGAPGCTKAGLSDDAVKEIEKKFRENHKRKITIPDGPYLNIERKPLLLVHFINIDKEYDEDRSINSDEKSIELVKDIPVIALALGFPRLNGTEESQKVKYIINLVEARSYLEFEGDDEYDEN